jgi:lipopolysaccharide/colanic/teichoic acid biosynthesis glycosyltransferase
MINPVSLIRNTAYNYFKLIFDVSVCLIVILISLPFFLIIAFFIKIDSSGPIFFRQLRVGRNNKLFHIIKFRTMIEDKNRNGPLITIGDDPRITKVGKYLRKYKIDEFPQLLNVVFGEMSLVGPRPEVPKYVMYYPSELRKKILSVRPGITDPSSIFFRNENELLQNIANPELFYIENIIPKKLTLYEKYIDDKTFLGDVMIIFRTILVIFDH